MKYIKRFNETIDNIKQDIGDYLAYLLDDDTFRCNIQDEEDYIEVKIIKYHSVAIAIMRWDIIKDNIIPFLYQISNEYDMKEFDYTPIKNPEGVYKKSLHFPDGTGVQEHIYDSEKSTIMFRKYRRKTYDCECFYMDIEDVIGDSKNVPEQFYEIILRIKK